MTLSFSMFYARFYGLLFVLYLLFLDPSKILIVVIDALFASRVEASAKQWT